jgi:two-component system, LuxR family, response regulator FixJ
MAEILIIEDDIRLRSEIQKFLETKGHGVSVASDGKEGLDSIRHIGYDVIVMDVKLPEMSGTDVLREISQTLPSHPPIILITGHGDKSTAIKAVHFGAFDFIEKPFSPPVLDTSIERALTEKKQDILNFKAYLAMPDNEGLTAREKEVAHLAADGLSNEEIAVKLSLGAETVKTHLKKIFRKLGVANRTALSTKLRK